MKSKAACLDVQGCWCFRFHDDTAARGLISHLQTALKALLLIPRLESKQHMQGIASAATAVTTKQNSQVPDTASVQAVLDQLGPANMQQLIHEALQDPEFPRSFSSAAVVHSQLNILPLDSIFILHVALDTCLQVPDECFECDVPCHTLNSTVLCVVVLCVVCIVRVRTFCLSAELLSMVESLWDEMDCEVPVTS